MRKSLCGPQRTPLSVLDTPCAPPGRVRRVGSCPGRLPFLVAVTDARRVRRVGSCPGRLPFLVAVTPARRVRRVGSCPGRLPSLVAVTDARRVRRVGSCPGRLPFLGRVRYRRPTCPTCRLVSGTPPLPRVRNGPPDVSPAVRFDTSASLLLRVSGEDPGVQTTHQPPFGRVSSGHLKTRRDTSFFILFWLSEMSEARVRGVAFTRRHVWRTWGAATSLPTFRDTTNTRF